jgi:lysophospholipase L1-like esterase
MKKSVKIAALCTLFVFLASCVNNSNENIINISKNSETMGEIRYVAVGDSYTIGEGIGQEKAWPVILAKHLRENGISIRLVANPSRTGWTAQDAIENEIPVFTKSGPDFATLLIGVNDWVQGVDKNTFRQRLDILIGQMQKNLKKPSSMIILTIPDFSAAPAGRFYGGGRNISRGISEFNGIIKEVAAIRNIKVVDIYPATQDMASNPELVAVDGLHPSPKEHEIWESMVYPIAYDILKES